MDIAETLLVFAGSLLMMWVLVIGPACFYFGAKIVRYEGLSLRRAVGVHGLYFGIFGLVSSILVSFVPPPIHLAMYFVLGGLSLFACLFAVKLLTKTTRSEWLKLAGFAFLMMNVLATFGAWAWGMEQDLDPEVKEALKPVREEDPQKNLFYSLMGFTIDPGGPVHKLGWQRVLKINAGKGTMDDKSIGRSSVAEQFDAGHLDAYLALYRFEWYENTVAINPLAHLPNMAVLTKMNGLVLEKIQQDFDENKFDQASITLGGEIRFNRMLLAQSDTAFIKMLAVRGLQECFKMYGTLLDSESFARSGALSKAELDGFSSEEQSISRMMSNEIRVVAGMAESFRRDAAMLRRRGMNQLPPWLTSIAWKHNDALNLSFKNLMRLRYNFAVPPVEYVELNENDKRPVYSTWDQIMRPSAVMFVEMTTPSFAAMYERVQSVDCWIRLLTLKQQILLNGIPRDGVAALLEKQEDDLKNPYTHDPMIWNPKDSTLICEGLRSNGRNVVVLNLGI